MEVMKMMKEHGKINFSGIIMILLIVYGGYAAVKLISAGAMGTQIRKEVIDTLGTLRGADFSEEEAVEAVKKVLLDHAIIYDEEAGSTVQITLNREKGTITFLCKYDVETNFLFFKKRKTVELKEGLKSYD